MLRPVYETAADLAKEEAVAEECVRCWTPRHGITAQRKLTISYGLDRVFSYYDDTVALFAEVKIRDWAFGAGNGYWIALLKVLAARQLADLTHLPTLLVAEFRDGSRHWVDFDRADPTRTFIGGRRDRGDPHDIEPMVTIPWPSWKPLELLLPEKLP